VLSSGKGRRTVAWVVVSGRRGALESAVGTIDDGGALGAGAVSVGGGVTVRGGCSVGCGEAELVAGGLVVIGVVVTGCVGRTAPVGLTSCQYATTVADIAVASATTPATVSAITASIEWDNGSRRRSPSWPPSRRPSLALLRTAASCHRRIACAGRIGSLELLNDGRLLTFRRP
jgi:hypothetical protein